MSRVLVVSPGSCGKCFEVRCRTGTIQYQNEDLTTDTLRRVVVPGLKDPEGREWPGLRPDMDPSIWWTKCRNEDTSIVITIIDSCPCTYIGGRRQKFCCGPLDHFDLSYWAFNKLAHPAYGLMMLEYRQESETGQIFLFFLVARVQVDLLVLYATSCNEYLFNPCFFRTHTPVYALINILHYSGQLTVILMSLWMIANRTFHQEYMLIDHNRVGAGALTTRRNPP